MSVLRNIPLRGGSTIVVRWKGSRIEVVEEPRRGKAKYLGSAYAPERAFEIADEHAKGRTLDDHADR